MICADYWKASDRVHFPPSPPVAPEIEPSTVNLHSAKKLSISEPLTFSNLLNPLRLAPEPSSIAVEAGNPLETTTNEVPTCPDDVEGEEVTEEVVEEITEDLPPEVLDAPSMDATERQQAPQVDTSVRDPLQTLEDKPPTEDSPSQEEKKKPLVQLQPLADLKMPAIAVPELPVIKGPVIGSTLGTGQPTPPDKPPPANPEPPAMAVPSVPVSVPAVAKPTTTVRRIVVKRGGGVAGTPVKKPA